MPPHRLSLLIVMSLLSFLGCSRPSTELPASLKELNVEISIIDETERGEGESDNTFQRITVVLKNAKGVTIERSDVTVEVNNVPLVFRVATGNYYDRHPYYQLPADSKIRVTANTEFRFVLVLPNGIRHEIGRVRTPAPLNVAQFDFARRRPSTGDITLAWRDLPEAATLTVFRSNTYLEGNAQVLESGSATDPTALRREIGPAFLRRSSDRWAVPADFLGTRDGRTLRSLGAEVSVTHEGKVASTFSRESSLRATRRLTLWMECTPTE